MASESNIAHLDVASDGRVGAELHRRAGDPAEEGQHPAVTLEGEHEHVREVLRDNIAHLDVASDAPHCSFGRREVGS